MGRSSRQVPSPITPVPEPWPQHDPTVLIPAAQRVSRAGTMHESMAKHLRPCSSIPYSGCVGSNLNGSIKLGIGMSVVSLHMITPACQRLTPIGRPPAHLLTRNQP